MNFLAHAFLSGNDTNLIIGNMIADFVKGSHFNQYPTAIQKGIVLHREIDRYTDHHPIVKSCRKLFYPEISHYALVIVDVVFDHFLGKHWEKYHLSDLKTFSQNVYTLMENNHSVLPERFQFILPRMIAHDWLTSYSHKELLFESFHGLSRRSPGFIYAEKTKELFLKNESELEESFFIFFPELIAHTNKKRLS